jgi:LysM repeat protein
MESRFGHDFSQVRVHTDAKAAKSARAVNALAYTVGRDVVFGTGQYQPKTDEGKHLLTHELVHVLQQGDRSSLRSKLEIGTVEDGSEREADDIARCVLNNQSLLNRISPNHQAQLSGVIQREQAETPASEVPREMEYEVVRGDSLSRIAHRFGTTVDALRAANNLRDTNIRAGQRLRVPAVAGCTIQVPTSANTQLIAGAIFAEAAPRPADNDEREAIGWAFVNSVQHTEDLCAGTICQSLNDTQRQSQCRRDTRDLGTTIMDAVRIGSAAYNNSRWRMVMSGNRLLPPANLCLISPSSEIIALIRSITAAEAVMGRTATPRNYLRFNRASDSPPSDRMEQAGSHEGHTFYRFIQGRECG